MNAAGRTGFNAKKYGALFAHGVAHTIATDAENQAAIKEKRYRIDITLNPVETLRLLMENRGLKQADLVPAIDSKSHVSEILSGARELSKAHIMKLSNFFHVSPEVFFPSVAAR